MRSLLEILLSLIVMGGFIHPSLGQSKIDTIEFEKGEILDILLLSQYENTDVDLKSYFQTAFPIAQEMSYQPLPGFKIDKHCKGNLRPELLILGKWNDIEVREGFLSQIIREVPDFHERRRKIWSYFGLRYFEIKEDLFFEINRDHFHAASAYWIKSKSKLNAFCKKWQKQVQESGGKILIQLKEGKSPFGYQYNPEYFAITSWENEAAYREYQDNMETPESNQVLHVNEFILK